MDKNNIWPRPVIIPAPTCVPGVENPIQSLAGTWKLCLEPGDSFWEKGYSDGLWQDVPVPSTLAALGIRPKNKCEYTYKTTLNIPEHSEKMHMVLRFSAVNCYARVWLDGHFVRSHYGGYNTWDADITPYAVSGGKHELTIGVTDCRGTMSQFHYGGIIRDVYLITVPHCHFERFHVNADLDAQYENGLMAVDFSLAKVEDPVRIVLQLSGPAGIIVPLVQNEVWVEDTKDMQIRIPVGKPDKWDAEHPNIYRLQADLYVAGQLVESVERRLGFRKIERKEERVYINGMEVKLRGVNREEVHPLTGRTLTKEDIKKEVLLFKEANINFVRTSHYNPSQYFLDLCDEYGIYVEEETSVSFVGQGQDFTNDDPEYMPHYMNQFAEMIEMDLSRPSVIIWSLGNESMWGCNLRAQLKYAKLADPSRLTIFSYPITMRPDEEQVDIWSAHYAEWYNQKNLMTDNNKSANTDILQPIGKIRYPVLHDEYCHPAHYNHLTLAKDQGSRDFWGESIARFWDDIFNTRGALGGAIWNGIDEVWLCPDHPDEIFEWGIIDGYRRKKPEHWHTKKAYSPIYIPIKELGTPCDSELRIPIQNRYNHTNLQEVSVICEIGDERYQFPGPNIPPHRHGELTLPKRSWRGGDIVTLSFQESNGLICDIYRLPVRKQAPGYPQPGELSPVVCESDSQLIAKGDDFEYRFEKSTGSFSLFCDGTVIIPKGVSLHIDNVDPEEWKCSSVQFEHKKTLLIEVNGSYGPVKVNYRYIIDGAGLLQVYYRILKIPYTAPARQKLNYGIDVGGYREVGLSFTIADFLDRLEWEKDSQWGIYPEDHIGREKGVAKKHRNDTIGGESYRKPPLWLWKDDMANYALFGKYDHGLRGTKDFTSLKSNVYNAAVYNSETGVGIEVLSDTSDSVRLEWSLDESSMISNNDERIIYKGSWASNVDHGCYNQTEMRSNCRGDSVEITFEGTGISWIAKQDIMYGMAQVYVDGYLAEPQVSLMPRGDSGLKEGAQTLYRQPVFTVQNLPYGRHSLRIVVAGEKACYWGYFSYNSYVSIDSFILIDQKHTGKLKMIVDQEYNYPDLAWGNYVKEPILVSPGYEGKVTIRPFLKS